MRKTNNICVFDIKNRQEDYAHVLEFIECCESASNKNLKDTISNLIRIMDEVSVKGGVVDKGIAARYYESPIRKRTSESNDKYVSENGIRKLRRLMKSSIDENGIHYFINHEMLYHIRIHLEDECNAKLINLQYLALLLQRLENLFVGNAESKKRLSVFIVPGGGVSCPYLDVNGMNDTQINNNVYRRVSGYLRLLSNEYGGIIYGAKIKGNSTEIVPIDYKVTNRTDELFPLVIVGQKNYKELFEERVSAETLIDLFDLKNNKRYGKAGAENPNDAVCDYIAETSFWRLQKNINFDEQKVKEIKQYLLKKESVTWISFSIFCFITNTKDALAQDIDYIWESAMNLNMGIKQLVQNSIQYSEKQTSIFSFILTNESVLEITIADLNYKQSMIDNFVENLSWEYDNIADKESLIGHKKILESKNDIYLRNLFSEFEDEDNIDIWKCFRQQDISAHIGLLLFYIAAQRCNAIINLRSSIYYRQSDNKSIYHKNLKTNEVFTQEKNTSAIPGTQFSITIPIGTLQKYKMNGLGQLNLASKVEENYDSFVKSLEYECSEIGFIKICNQEISSFMKEQEITNSKSKFLLVRKWREIWLRVFKENKEKNKDLYYIDLGEVEDNPYFLNGDNLEVFIKGFLETVLHLTNYQIKALAFINASRLFVEIYRDAFIAFAPRRFSKEIQIYISEKDCVDNLILFGANYFDAVKNGFIMSMEHGSNIMNAKEYVTAKSLYEKTGDFIEGNNKESIRLIPFDVILPNGDGRNKIFDKRLFELANNDIDGENAGFLIRNTHMRLGSKVHIHSFYEMPFLFYRTSIANRIAFQILKDMKEQNVVDIEKDKIIFYGYASYSKAILTSITEILKAYRIYKGAKEDSVSFISYQYNLQSESEEIQMHYGFSSGFPAKLENDKIEMTDLIKVIQIVPISSTLTTFEKMWNRLQKTIEKDSEENICVAGNYTIFWITNELNKEPNEPTEIEKPYWSRVRLPEQLIETNFKEFMDRNINLIRYFIRCPVKWEHPLKCKWCYPKSLIDEVPLVETDQTSTVPTQQIRKKISVKNKAFNDNDANIERIKKLNDCVAYGHIMREQNHFQYYIDTQTYFYKVKEEVKRWLAECRETANEANEANDLPMMHVIFSPEHNTNVGFAQYVNTYYFGGVAEIVSINGDKEFRSNFVCEHAALIETIADLYRYIEVNGLDDMPIKFYYVDDTIISGETFQKANSFLRSLLPPEYRNKYGTNIVSKCFLLVDRLSLETKRNYVRDVNNDFYSFVHVDISNMRTQGDSCVGCKLKQDAIRLFKRSATRNIEKYWSNKIRSYVPVRYDERKKVKNFQTKDAYKRLVISHIAQNVIFNDNNSYEIGMAYDSILVLALKLCNKKEKIREIEFYYNNLISEVEGIEDIGKFFKIISRPFFSFDFKIKLQVLTLIICLAELLLGNQENLINYEWDSENSHILKKFLIENNRISKTIKLWRYLSNEMTEKSKLIFLQEVLIECMTDMKSTYLLRKSTLKCMYDFIQKYSIEEQEDFWKIYVQNIHRIIDCSSDEMRSFNLEYLLLYGEEYSDFERNLKTNSTNFPEFLYKAISGREKPQEKDPFYIFCHEVLLQNTRILFDGIEKDLDREQSTDTYYMEQWRGFRNLENLIQCYQNDNLMPENEEKDLFEFLKNENVRRQMDPRTLVKERYEKFLQNISSMVVNKYNLKADTLKIALLTWTPDSKNEERRAVIGELDILTGINVIYPENKYDIKEKIVKALNVNKEKCIFSLEENGYCLADGRTSYFVIFFDNPGIDIEDAINRTLKPIAKVFMYLEIETMKVNGDYQLRFILRDILTYRNRIMRMLESDFAGDMFTKYAHTIGEKNIIAHEKAISHNNTIDNERVLGFLMKQNILNKYDNLDSYQAIKWLLLRNYVNEQIAKLFNRSFQEEDKSLQPRIPETPILYIDIEAKKYNNVSPFNSKLTSFMDLNLITDDRFKLLESIININYIDLQKARFIEDERERGYNVEFMKCILIDIIFSAISHEVSRHEFLLSIDFLLGYRKRFRNDGLLPDNDIIQKLRKDYIITLQVEKSENEIFDYLVIRNPIYKTLNDWHYKNEVIKKRMDDPLDYPDGHLSLLTIARYIEGLRDELVGKTEFRYYEEQDNQLWFQSRLPIIRKEES